MIVLPIAKSVDDDTPQEWSLLELNGEIVLPNKVPEGGDHLEFGTIELDEDGKTATLIIAAHELKGKVEVLKEPFIVMRPCKRPRIDYDPETEASVEEGGGTAITCKKRRNGYEVAGVVKSKVLFDKYPKSIMK